MLSGMILVETRKAWHTMKRFFGRAAAVGLLLLALVGVFVVNTPKAHAATAPTISRAVLEWNLQGVDPTAILTFQCKAGDQVELMFLEAQITGVSAQTETGTTTATCTGLPQTKSPVVHEVNTVILLGFVTIIVNMLDLKPGSNAPPIATVEGTTIPSEGRGMIIATYTFS